MMMTFKELTVQKTRNGFLPILPLNGKWLEDIGFVAPCSVGTTILDACLTLTLNGGTDLQVQSRMVGKRPRTTLDINVFLLHKCGLRIGDRVGLTLDYGTIQIQKIVRYTTD